jgi:hypothetical protein
MFRVAKKRIVIVLYGLNVNDSRGDLAGQGSRASSRITVLGPEAKAAGPIRRGAIVKACTHLEKPSRGLVTEPRKDNSSLPGARRNRETSTAIRLVLPSAATESDWIFFNKDLQGSGRLGTGLYYRTNV